MSERKIEGDLVYEKDEKGRWYPIQLADDEQKLQATLQALKKVREKLKTDKVTEMDRLRERQLTRRYVRLVQNGL